MTCKKQKPSEASGNPAPARRPQTTSHREVDPQNQPPSPESIPDMVRVVTRGRANHQKGTNSTKCCHTSPAWPAGPS